jgi:hypothetical protein
LTTLHAHIERITGEEMSRLQRRAQLDAYTNKLIGQVLDDLLATLLLSRLDELATENPELLARVTELFSPD